MDFLDANIERRQDELDAEIKTIEFKASNVAADRLLQFDDDPQSLRLQYGTTRQKELDAGPQNSTNQPEQNAAQAGERVVPTGTARPPQASPQPLNGDQNDD